MHLTFNPMRSTCEIMPPLLYKVKHAMQETLDLKTLHALAVKMSGTSGQIMSQFEVTLAVFSLDLCICGKMANILYLLTM